jgi:hypothetical protein
MVLILVMNNTLSLGQETEEEMLNKLLIVLDNKVSGAILLIQEVYMG